MCGTEISTALVQDEIIFETTWGQLQNLKMKLRERSAPLNKKVKTRPKTFFYTGEIKISPRLTTPRAKFRPKQQIKDSTIMVGNSPHNCLLVGISEVDNRDNHPLVNGAYKSTSARYAACSSIELMFNFPTIACKTDSQLILLISSWTRNHNYRMYYHFCMISGSKRNHIEQLAQRLNKYL